MKRHTLAAAVLVLSFASAGCGQDAPHTPPAIDTIPSCVDVIVTGDVGPILVNGCRTAAGVIVTPAGWDCQDGRKLRGADQHWWYSGDVVHDGLPPADVVAECLGT